MRLVKIAIAKGQDCGVEFRVSRTAPPTRRWGWSPGI